MYKALNSILKGMLFVFLDINLIIDLAADTYGLFLIAQGCAILYDKYDEKQLLIARKILLLLMPFTLLIDLNIIRDMLTVYIQYYNIFVMLTLPIIYMLIFDVLFKHEEATRSIKGFVSFFIIYQLLETLLPIFSQYQVYDIYVFISIACGAISFIITVMLMFKVKGLRDLYTD